MPSQSKALALVQARNGQSVHKWYAFRYARGFLVEHKVDGKFVDRLYAEDAYRAVSIVKLAARRSAVNLQSRPLFNGPAMDALQGGDALYGVD